MNINNKILMIGIMSLLVITCVSAYLGQTYKPFSFLETDDLLVNDDAVITNDLRVDGVSGLYGGVMMNNPCQGTWANIMLDENGNLVKVCVPTKK